MTLPIGELSHITPADIDSHGALRIPVWARYIKKRLMCYIRDCGISEISYHTRNGIKRAPIIFLDDEMYVVMQHACFAKTSLRKLSVPIFDNNGVCGEQLYSLEHNGATYCDENIDSVIKSAREGIWRDQITQIAQKYRAPRYAVDIIVRAMNITINAKRKAPISIKLRQHINNVISNLPAYFAGINTFCNRYKNNDALDELSCLSLQELGNIILPIASQNLGQTCTRIVKRHPENPNHVHAMMVAGYKNPGCFPYQWLANTPKNQRGALTDQLHAVFKRAVCDLYCPEQMSDRRAQQRFDSVLNMLARQITTLTGISTQIEYFNHGFFSKTYKIDCDSQSYILKIYHSSVQYYTSKLYAHDIEAQNSFLVSGKKYCGNVRYRTVLTAGISNQRGQRYILYPFVNGKQVDVKHNPYDVFKTYHFCDDVGNGNQCGNTIIDTGMIYVNECRIGRPYMTKIINTILYRPWDDLMIVLGKYTPKQISECIKFILERVEPDTPKHKMINAKLEFLTRKIHSR